MIFAITPNGIGKSVGARAIEFGWPLVDGETFTVEHFEPGLVLAEDGVSLREGTPEELAERRTVPKSVVISRLTDEQLDNAIGAMTNRQRERWRSPDSPAVYADDEEVIGLITAIGADPEIILAP